MTYGYELSLYNACIIWYDDVTQDCDFYSSPPLTVANSAPLRSPEFTIPIRLFLTKWIYMYSFGLHGALAMCAILTCVQGSPYGHGYVVLSAVSQLWKAY
jgi:hypothetical protein